MAELGTPPHFDCSVEVKKDNLNKHEFFKILKHLRPTWNPDDLVCQDISGGYLNLIVRCYLKSYPDDAVAFRIWAKLTKELEVNLDRDMEKTLIHKLGEKGVAPRLYASFKNGVCYEFFDGEKLSPALCKTDDIARSIAKNLAIIHTTQLDGFNSEQNSLKTVKNGFKCYPCPQPDEAQKRMHQASIPTKEEVKKEIEFLEDYIIELQCPTVQCHGDPHAQNMMYNKDTGRVIFLDYELAHVGCQSSDIVYFFSTSIIDYNDLQKRFSDMGLPEETFQRKFLRWYLEYWFESTGRNASDVAEKDVERLFTQVNKYLLLLHFRSGLTSLLIATHDTKDVLHDDIKSMDLYEVGKKHFQVYFENKDYLRSLKLPE